MSGQYGLSKEQQEQILSIIHDNNVDETYDEVSIKVSGYNDNDELETKMYIEVD